MVADILALIRDARGGGYRLDLAYRDTGHEAHINMTGSYFSIFKRDMKSTYHSIALRSIFRANYCAKKHLQS